MASLTTVYLISMVLTSIAGIASAFVGSKIYPLSGGAESPQEPVPPIALPQTLVEPPASENSQLKSQ